MFNVSVANAAAPIIQVSITTSKTGSEPFDASTWDPSSATNAGQDESTFNNVVRLQDTITYQVEMSLNDSDATAMVAEVVVDPRQRWVQLPDECKTDQEIVSGIYDSVTGELGGDGRLLRCNIGTAVEGTNRVLYPVARVIASSYDGTIITLNDDHTGASVAAYAVNEDGTSELATSGPTDTIITAGFKVNLLKTLTVTGFNSEGEPLYRPYYATGPNGEAGTVMEYIIRGKYESGSMLADSPNNDNLASYELLDYYSDDNPGNNATGFSSGAVLYSWGESGPACRLVGDHGASAAVDCVADEIAGDFTGPAYVPDGVNDHTVSIDLTDIDVRDPDGDGNLFEIKVEMWFAHTTELETDPSCSTGKCEIYALNGVGVYDAATGTSVGFNPVSTEDASGTNLPNFGGAGEPHPDDTWAGYPLYKTWPGGWNTVISFAGEVPWGNGITKESILEKVAPGEKMLVLHNIFDYRKYQNGISQSCAKVDTSKFIFAGFSEAPTTRARYGFNRNRDHNPSMSVWGGTSGTQYYDGSEFTTFLYSNEPHDTIAEVRSDTCDDDVNADGVVNIVDMAGNESSPGSPVDWYENPDDVPGGEGGVTKIRMETEYVKDEIKARYSDHLYWAIATNYDFQVRPDLTEGYGPDDLLAVWSTSRLLRADLTWSNWDATESGSVNPDDAGFGYDSHDADRIQLVTSAHSIKKHTVPSGIKVVLAGQDIDFEIVPEVIGKWDEAAINTARVYDTMDSRTQYVFGSEVFSVDGGNSWMSFAEYQASNPDVAVELAGSVVTTDGHGAGSTRLEYLFSDIQVGEQLPLIRYTVHVDESVSSGRFVNNAYIDSPMGVDNDEDGEPDIASARYELFMEAGTGFDIVKSVGEQIVEVDAPITFSLVYRNLGLEDYTKARFIDILPFGGDADFFGGVASKRTPGSDFSGTYEVGALSGSNGEVFYASTASPMTISMDPCDSSNLPAGYVPAAGDLCSRVYEASGNSLPDGEAAGTGEIEWVQCTSTEPVVCGDLDPEDITAISFEVANVRGGGHTAAIRLDPTGNIGGDPAFTVLGEVAAGSTGDLYTNNFGGRIAEISLNVISNDVSATVVNGSIGDRVWLDDDGDGVQDADEVGVENITVSLLVEDPAAPGTFIPYLIPDPSGSGDMIAYEVTTDANGEYLFDNLPSGLYKVEVTPSDPISGLGQTYDADGAGDNASIIELFGPGNPAPGLTAANYGDVDDVDDQDFGYDPTPGSIGDRIWLDTNGDGIQDSDEAGIEGVEVVVIYLGPDGIAGTSDDEEFTATTDADGVYNVDNLPLGEYTVTVNPDTLPPMLVASFDADGGLDSTSSVALTSAAPANIDQDFGYTHAGAIGDTVWFDVNGDGVMDDDEPRLPEVSVTVTWAGADGEFGTADDEAFPAVTDENGNYLVERLQGGDYTVAVDESTLPEWADPTFDDDGGLDSISATSLSADEPVDLDQDFGYTGNGMIGDTIWFDVNGDGIHDETEYGLEGIEVQVTDLGPDGLLGTEDDVVHVAVTDENGEYLVANLLPGEYHVEVTSVPDGYIQTADPDEELDRKSVTTITVSEPVDLDQDFGFNGTGSIGDTVWYDADGDGVQDDDEQGLAGVSVTVTYLGPDGIAGTADDVSYTKVTDENGNYGVDSLPFGPYEVSIDTDTAPDGMELTTDAVTSLELTPSEPNNLDQDFGLVGVGEIGRTVWLDLDGDGEMDDNEPGLPEVTVDVIYLGPDGELGGGDDLTRTVVTGPDGSFNATGLPYGPYVIEVDTETLPEGLRNTFDLDGGLDSMSATSLSASEPSDLNHIFGYTSESDAAIDGTVWVDSNGDGVVDPGEPTIGGVDLVVVAYGRDGILGTADDFEVLVTTGPDGTYQVPGLPYGDYDITLDPATVPADYTAVFDVDGVIDGFTQVTLTKDAPVVSARNFGYQAPAIPATLAFTGTSSGVLSGIAILLLTSGLALIVLSRRQGREA